MPDKKQNQSILTDIQWVSADNNSLSSYCLQKARAIAKFLANQNKSTPVQLYNAMVFFHNIGAHAKTAKEWLQDPTMVFNLADYYQHIEDKIKEQQLSNPIADMMVKQWNLRNKYQQVLQAKQYIADPKDLTLSSYLTQLKQNLESVIQNSDLTEILQPRELQIIQEVQNKAAKLHEKNSPQYHSYIEKTIFNDKRDFVQNIANKYKDACKLECKKILYKVENLDELSHKTYLGSYFLVKASALKKAAKCSSVAREFFSKELEFFGQVTKYFRVKNTQEYRVKEIKDYIIRQKKHPFAKQILLQYQTFISNSILLNLEAPQQNSVTLNSATSITSLEKYIEQKIKSLKNAIKKHPDNEQMLTQALMLLKETIKDVDTWSESRAEFGIKTTYLERQTNLQARIQNSNTPFLHACLAQYKLLQQNNNITYELEESDNSLAGYVMVIEKTIQDIITKNPEILPIFEDNLTFIKELKNDARRVSYADNISYQEAIGNLLSKKSNIFAKQIISTYPAALEKLCGQIKYRIENINSQQVSLGSYITAKKLALEKQCISSPQTVKILQDEITLLSQIISKANGQESRLKKELQKSQHPFAAKLLGQYNDAAQLIDKQESLRPKLSSLKDYFDAKIDSLEKRANNVSNSLAKKHLISQKKLLTDILAQSKSRIGYILAPATNSDTNFFDLSYNFQHRGTVSDRYLRHMQELSLYLLEVIDEYQNNPLVSDPDKSFLKNVLSQYEQALEVCNTNNINGYARITKMCKSSEKQRRIVIQEFLDACEHADVKKFNVFILNKSFVKYLQENFNNNEFIKQTGGIFAKKQIYDIFRLVIAGSDRLKVFTTRQIQYCEQKRVAMLEKLFELLPEATLTQDITGADGQIVSEPAIDLASKMGRNKIVDWCRKKLKEDVRQEADLILKEMQNDIKLTNQQTKLLDQMVNMKNLYIQGGLYSDQIDSILQHTDISKMNKKEKVLFRIILKEWGLSDNDIDDKSIAQNNKENVNKKLFKKIDKYKLDVGNDVIGLLMGIAVDVANDSIFKKNPITPEKFLPLRVHNKIQYQASSKLREYYEKAAHKFEESLNCDLAQLPQGQEMMIMPELASIAKEIKDANSLEHDNSYAQRAANISPPSMIGM